MYQFISYKTHVTQVLHQIELYYLFNDGIRLKLGKIVVLLHVNTSALPVFNQQNS